MSRLARESMLVAAHACTSLGRKAWEFAVPLLLAVAFGRHGVAAAAGFGLAVEAGKLFFAPALGRAADARGRLAFVAAALLAQATAVAAASALLCELVRRRGGRRGGAPAAAVYLALCACGAVEAVCSGAVNVSVARDWTPALAAMADDADDAPRLYAPLAAGEEVDGADDGASADVDEAVAALAARAASKRLTALNASLQRWELVMEMAGPLLAGLLLPGLAGDDFEAAHRRGATAVAAEAAAVVVGAVGAGVLVPQYVLLRRVYGTSVLRHGRRGDGCVVDRRASCATSAADAWLKLWANPGGLVLLSLAYALLSFTVLSPHDAVMTAYLGGPASPFGHVRPRDLAVFRAAGALFGVAGVSAFAKARGAVPCRGTHGSSGLRGACGAFVAWQATAAAAAAATFHARARFPVFAACVVLSRFGLYGFDTGALQLFQENADEGHANAVGNAQAAMASVATLAVLGCAAFAHRGVALKALVDASAACVAAAAAAFGVWTLLWRETTHSHDDVPDADGHDDASAHVQLNPLNRRAPAQPRAPRARHRPQMSQAHAHTLQHERALQRNPARAHTHALYVGPTCCSAAEPDLRDWPRMQLVTPSI